MSAGSSAAPQCGQVGVEASVMKRPHDGQVRMLHASWRAGNIDRLFD
jgi:hypothetical protein